MSGGLVYVSTGGQGIYSGISIDGTLWKWEINQWVQLQSPAYNSCKLISIGADGTMMAITNGDITYRMNESGWQYIPGGCANIDIADQYNIACVTIYYDLYLWSMSLNNWVKIPNPPFAKASISSDRQIVGINGLGEVYYIQLNRYIKTTDSYGFPLT